jgi:hypothetical protein
MKVGDGWIHTNPDNGEAIPVYGTPLDTGAIYDPRSDTDPKPYCDHQTATGNRFTFAEIHPNGIRPVEGRRFDH